MKAINLYKFISDKEWRYETNPDTQKEDVILFVMTYDIDDFYELMKHSGVFDDYGLEVTMKDGYFAFWMKDIADYFGIELDEVFEKEKQYA